MNTSDVFKEFLNNIKISEEKADTISYRYGRITGALNSYFRNTDSKTNNCLQVGSYGRYTGIKNISDLDMLYILLVQNGKIIIKRWAEEEIEDTKKALLETYPESQIKIDRCGYCEIF